MSEQPSAAKHPRHRTTQGMSVPDDTEPALEGMPASALPSRVLVLARDPQRASRLETVLEFLECEPLICADRPERDTDAAHDWLAWLVSGCLGDQLGDILNELPDLAPRVPVVLVGEASDFPALTRSAAAQVVRRVDYPARYPQLADALQSARHVVANGGPDEARSLELFRSLVGRNPLVQRIRRLIEQVAATDANVLILGETGTGKEVVARNIHHSSARREHPFVAVNCGAIPADLLESELFGHEKGAFTGALNARQGRFELAQGGTLFLDEIGDMPLPMQVKLLRVLQERTFERVGSNRSIQSDVRIIAATHRDLETAIDEGRFREDLYYRLNVFPIEVPPLRHRRGDLPLLISELTNRMEGEGRGSVRLGQSALRALAVYDWPGNVRELANLIERLAIMHPGETVEAQDLPAKFQREGDEDLAELADAALGEAALGPGPRLPEEGIDLKEYLNELEVGLIRRALEEASGVVAHAAKLLGMRRTTLVEKMRKFGISRAEDATEI
jgi:sigma-54 dependent transcriptional regulator, flagellar regulatory protein